MASRRMASLRSSVAGRRAAAAEEEKAAIVVSRRVLVSRSAPLHCCARVTAPSSAPSCCTVVLPRCVLRSRGRGLVAGPVVRRSSRSSRFAATTRLVPLVVTAAASSRSPLQRRVLALPVVSAGARSASSRVASFPSPSRSLARSTRRCRSAIALPVLPSLQLQFVPLVPRLRLALVARRRESRVSRSDSRAGGVLGPSPVVPVASRPVLAAPSFRRVPVACRPVVRRSGPAFSAPVTAAATAFSATGRRAATTPRCNDCVLGRTPRLQRRVLAPPPLPPDFSTSSRRFSTVPATGRL